jgi:hypothetical protein
VPVSWWERLSSRDPRSRRKINSRLESRSHQEMKKAFAEM